MDDATRTVLTDGGAGLTIIQPQDKPANSRIRITASA